MNIIDNSDIDLLYFTTTYLSHSWRPTSARGPLA